MKKFLVLFFLVAFAYCAKSQDFLGYNYGNYQTAGGMIFNPASIAGSRYKANVNILSVNVGLTNNAYQIRKKSLFGNYDDWSEGHDFSKINSSGSKDLNFNLDILGPSFMIDLGEKIGSFGFSTRLRFLLDEKNLDNNIFQLFGNSDENFFGKRHTQNDLRLDAHGFVDMGLTYARTVWNTENHVIKGGITAKYILGGVGASVKINNLEVEIDDELSEDMVKTLRGDLSVVYSEGIDDLINGDGVLSSIGNGSNGSLGLDFGVEYEWYKDGKKVNPANSRWTKNVTPYTLKASVSVTDIGRIKYSSSAYAGSYTINDLADYPVTDLDYDSDWSLSDYLSNMESKGIISHKDNESSYKMSLPTVLRANVDYNAYKMLYVNAGMVLNLTSKNKYAAHMANYFYVTPRFEYKWLNIYSPVSVSSNGNAHWGFGINAGAFFIGSGSVLSNLFSSNIKGVDVHFGFAVPITKKDKTSKNKGKDIFEIPEN